MSKLSQRDLLTVLHLAAGAVRDREDLSAVLALALLLEDERDAQEIVQRATRKVRGVKVA